MIDEEITETQLQDLIVAAADLGGWLVYHTYDSRRSRPGFPDLVMVRGDELIVLELKSAKGRVSPAQRAWIESLAQVDKISVAVLRPGLEAVALVARLVS